MKNKERYEVGDEEEKREEALTLHFPVADEEALGSHLQIQNPFDRKSKPSCLFV